MPQDEITARSVSTILVTARLWIVVYTRVYTTIHNRPAWLLEMADIAGAGDTTLDNSKKREARGRPAPAHAAMVRRR